MYAHGGIGNHLLECLIKLNYKVRVQCCVNNDRQPRHASATVDAHRCDIKGEGSRCMSFDANSLNLGYFMLQTMQMLCNQYWRRPITRDKLYE